MYSLTNESLVLFYIDNHNQLLKSIFNNTNIIMNETVFPQCSNNDYASLIGHNFFVNSTFTTAGAVWRHMRLLLTKCFTP
jgi:hypothetical protein